MNIPKGMYRGLWKIARLALMIPIVGPLVTRLTLFLSNVSRGYPGIDDIELSGEKKLLEYLRKNASWSEPILFDVGANVGSWSRIALQEFPHAGTFMFEPDSRLTPRIEALFSDIPSFSVWNIALGASNDSLVMNIYKDQHYSAGNSMVDHGSDVSKELLHQKVEVWRGDQFCQTKSIKHINFLKIDVEGW